MSHERPAPLQSKLVASVPAEGGSVLLFTFAYAVGASTSHMSVATVSDSDQQSSGKSGKFKFDDWLFVDFPEESSSTCPLVLRPFCIERL